MKPIKDTTCFDRNVPLLHTNGQNKIFCLSPPSVRFDTRAFYFADKNIISEPLYALAIFNGRFLTGYHYRCINSYLFALEYVKRGNLATRQNDQAFLAEPGDIFLMHPGYRNEITVGPAGFCEKTSIVLHGPLLPEMLRLYGLDKAIALTDRDAKGLEKIFQELEFLAAKTDNAAKKRNSCLIYSLLQILREPAETRKHIPPDMEILANRLGEDCESQWTIKAMAEMSNCTTTWLIRRFRKAFGVTPYQMLLRLRMEKAARLLLSREDLLVKEISKLCGYANPLNFSTEFTKRYGDSPTMYRKKLSILNTYELENSISLNKPEQSS